MCLQGKSGISQIENFHCEDFATRFAGEIKGFECNGYVSKKNERRMDNCIKYTLVAGKKVYILVKGHPLSAVAHCSAGGTLPVNMHAQQALLGSKKEA